MTDDSSFFFIFSLKHQRNSNSLGKIIRNKTYQSDVAKKRLDIRVKHSVVSKTVLVF